MRISLALENASSALLSHVVAFFLADAALACRYEESDASDVDDEDASEDGGEEEEEEEAAGTY